MLHRIMVNDGAAGSSIVIYDNTAGSGTILGTIETASIASPTSLQLGIPFFTGLTFVTTNVVAYTVVYE